MHLVEGNVLLHQLEDRSQSFLFGLEGRAPYTGWDSALTMDSRVTWRASCDNDATTAICAAVCCYSVGEDSCVKAIPVLLQLQHGYCTF